MIIESNYSVFEVNADCIVNTVNCDGFMGKGLALEFACRYPNLEKEYKLQCSDKLIKVGKVYFYNVDNQKIINFPTKDHYQYPSKIEWIDQGLKYFVINYRNYNITSIAFPILGGSNGGLDRELVVKLMKHYLGNLDLTVYICYATEISNKQKEQVNRFKALSDTDLNITYGLSAKMIKAINDERYKINCLSDIRKIKGLGKETYKKIYQILTNNSDTISLI